MKKYIAFAWALHCCPATVQDYFGHYDTLDEIKLAVEPRFDEDGTRSFECCWIFDAETFLFVGEGELCTTWEWKFCELGLPDHANLFTNSIKLKAVSDAPEDLDDDLN